ncbi:MAG TPA: DnaJ C-terminal domain-containing protein, partial [Candidatus Saccharimonadales bacterium]|nr:DnaJ C-terminal domain-containing protein [Candidatus Saccharimonadales bacterium]
DGPITMRVPPGTQSGSDFKLSDHGVPHLKGSSRGAHIVTITVDTPTKLTKDQQELLQAFQSDGGKKHSLWN